MPAARKRSTATTLGKHVELACGETVLVRPWGWDHLTQNTAVLTDVVIDTFNAIASSDDDEATGAAISGAITRNLAKLRALLIASLENGEADLDKVAGLGDVVSVVDAVIETNEIVEALAKGRARYRAILETLTPKEPELH